MGVHRGPGGRNPLSCGAMDTCRAVVVALLGLVAGCGAGTAEWRGDGAADGGLDAVEGDGPETVVFGGTVYRIKSDLSLLGAEVCLLNQAQPTCDLTDSVGRFRFIVPAESNQAVSITAPGFAGVVLAFRAGRFDLTTFSVALQSATDEKTYYSAAGIEWPSMSNGFLLIFTRDISGSSLEGVTSSLSPATGSGPIYDDPMGVADKTLQATSMNGTVHFGGVGPGTIDVGFGPSKLLCSAFVGGWPSPNTNAVQVPVVAGFETLLGVNCF